MVLVALKAKSVMGSKKGIVIVQWPPCLMVVHFEKFEEC